MTLKVKGMKFHVQTNQLEEDVGEKKTRILGRELTLKEGEDVIKRDLGEQGTFKGSETSPANGKVSLKALSLLFAVMNMDLHYRNL